MHFSSILIGASLLLAASAAPSPTLNERQFSDSCFAISNPQQPSNIVCGATGTIEPQDIYATPRSTSVSDCRAQCVRDSRCKSSSFLETSVKPDICWFSEKSLTELGLTNTNGGAPVSYDRGCSILAGECLPYATSFESATNYNVGNGLSPWTAIKGDATDSFELVNNGNKGNFTATPFGDIFLRVGKFGKNPVVLNQHILLNQGSRYQLDWSYNFQKFTKLSTVPTNYQLAIGYCGILLDKVVLKPTQRPKNRWISRRKVFKAPGCVESARVLRLVISAGGTSQQYIGTFGLDEIKVSRT